MASGLPVPKSSYPFILVIFLLSRMAFDVCEAVHYSLLGFSNKQDF